jgi:cytosine/adenosine deaminase-related metal-dependent hydrolase
LLRGTSYSRDLFDWGYNVYYPGTTAYEPEDAVAAVLGAMVESVRSGITTVVDNWSTSADPLRADEMATAALEAYGGTGVRTIFAPMFSDAIPPAWVPMIEALGPSASAVVDDLDQALAAIERLMGTFHNGAGLIAVSPSPTTVQTVSATGFADARKLAERFGSIIPVHHCETGHEARMFADAGVGLTSTDYLDKHGLLGPNLLLAHCVWISDRDVRLLAESAAPVAHCPTSNLVLASGIAPIQRLLNAGVKVGLGSDNAMLNNASIMGEARLASLLAKVESHDAAAVMAERAFEMATRGGAAAICRQDDLGRVQEGYLADLVVYDSSGSHWTPRQDPISALVYHATPAEVTTVVIDGKVVLRDGQLTWGVGVSEDRILRDVRDRATSLQARLSD